VTVIGSVGARHLARVDPNGALVPDGADWRLDWWIGADDRWHVPEYETAVRRRFLDDAPVVETAMRVPSGDALYRAYGTGGEGDLVTVEVENASPAPFVAAFVVRGVRQISLESAVALVDRRHALVFPRAPSRWAVGADAKIQVQVTSGSAESGPFRTRRDRAARLSAAFLFPVAHRTTLRAAVVLGRVELTEVDLARLPSAEEAARGWTAQLDRGMQIELPDDALVAAVHRARAQILLESSSERRPRAGLVAALEDWGFDSEAAYAWGRLSSRDRRAAANRPAVPPSWRDVDQVRTGAATDLLLTLRAALLHEANDGTVTLLADELPEGWQGQSLDVHNAPTRHGPVSYALRWHGERPALLWDAPSGVRLCAPALDATWVSEEPKGETLLAGSRR
jgi:hypothetical protein